MHTIEKVRLFHQKFGHPIASEPTVPEANVRALRLRLIAEELCELCDAWGFALAVHSDPEMASEADQARRVSLALRPGVVCSVVEAADALGDLDYVVQGANLVAGYPAEAVLDAIQESNMSKLGADGQPIRRDDGKILKGPNYFKPDIAGALAGAYG